MLSASSVLVVALDRVLGLYLCEGRLLLVLPALLWIHLGAVVGAGGLALWGLAAWFGRPGADFEARLHRFVTRVALALNCAAPWIVVRALQHSYAADHVFLWLYRDELLEHVERRAGPDNPFFRESSDHDPITLIGAVNYSLADYYWVIHAPAANGQRLERGVGGFEYDWARHVRGPWYVMFR